MDNLSVLFPLYSLPCGCSTKTALLTNCTWQEPLACALDTANIGAHLPYGHHPSTWVTSVWFLLPTTWRMAKSTSHIFSID